MSNQQQKKKFCHQMNGLKQKVRTISQLSRRFQLNQTDFDNENQYILKFKQNVFLDKSKPFLSPKSTSIPFLEIPQHPKKTIIEEKSKRIPQNYYLPDLQHRKSNNMISPLGKRSNSPFKGLPLNIIQNKQYEINENNGLRFQQLNRQLKSNLDNWADKDSTEEKLISKQNCLRFGDLFQHDKVRITSNNRMFRNILQKDNINLENFNKKESKGQFTKIAKGSTHKNSQSYFLKQSISTNKLQDTQPKQGLFKKEILKILDPTNLGSQFEAQLKKTKKLSFESLSMNKFKEQILTEFKTIMQKYFPERKETNNQEYEIIANKKQKIAKQIMAPLLISFCKQQTIQINNIIDSIPNILQNIDNLGIIQNIPIQISMKLQEDQEIKQNNQVNTNQLRDILTSNNYIEKIQSVKFLHEDQMKKQQLMTSLQANDRDQVIMSSLGSLQKLQFTMSPHHQ